mmetsp:Transcript_73839/g.210638  ORF Transcript_73839/g.210638 Transcript_73839/m.210638 type:complete len:210 (-) Transcript_73839:363-992(-)
MKGGLLRVLQQPDSSGGHFQELLLKGVPQELVETVKYTGPGYAIFMQGSKILHAVTPVLEAREPRYSLVNSYMTRDVFLRDPTKYHTFLSKGFDDRKDVVPLEYARHKAWRVKGQMKYILDEMAPGATPEEIAKILETTSEELKVGVSTLILKPPPTAHGPNPLPTTHRRRPCCSESSSKTTRLSWTMGKRMGGQRRSVVREGRAECSR